MQCRKCPACGLPMTVATMGTVASATSNDDSRHAVFAVCQRCSNGAKRLPPGVYRKTLNRAADRALDDPDAYLCKLVASPGAARLAVAMLRHPAHTLETLSALGWQ